MYVFVFHTINDVLGYKGKNKDKAENCVSLYEQEFNVSSAPLLLDMEHDRTKNVWVFPIYSMNLSNNKALVQHSAIMFLQ